MENETNSQNIKLFEMIQEVLEIEKRLTQPQIILQTKITTKKACEIKLDDKFIGGDKKIYKISLISEIPRTNKNTDIKCRLRFILNSNDDNTKIEKIYHQNSLLVVDESGFCIID